LKKISDYLERAMIHIGPLDLEKKAAIVAVILENPVETSKKAAAMGADALEVRLDLLGIKDLEKAAVTIREIKSKTHLPVIITNRPRNEGGKWEGRETERIRLIIGLLSLNNGPDAVDIELSVNIDERDNVVKTAKTHGRTVIISAHDFSKTPSFKEMKKTINEAFLAGADIAKIAVMPHSMRETLDLLAVTLDARDAGRTVCTIAMGKLGKHTRLIAPFYGSVLTYASVESTMSAAPGQLQVDEIKKVMELL
jgi:3-dehydroquinate dehydratase I